jgi:hypothetical protein
VASDLQVDLSSTLSAVVAGVFVCCHQFSEAGNLISVYHAGGQKLNWARRMPGQQENPQEIIFGWIGVVRGVR